MSDYEVQTNFALKDTLAADDPDKIIRGSEFDTEFNAISNAIISKSEIAPDPVEILSLASSSESYDTRDRLRADPRHNDPPATRYSDVDNRSPFVETIFNVNDVNNNILITFDLPRDLFRVISNSVRIKSNSIRCVIRNLDNDNEFLFDERVIVEFDKADADGTQSTNGGTSTVETNTFIALYFYNTSSLLDIAGASASGYQAQVIVEPSSDNFMLDKYDLPTNFLYITIAGSYLFNATVVVEEISNV